MSTRPSLSGSTKNSLPIVALLTLAIAVSTWSLVRYTRSAPVQNHIDNGVQFQIQGDSRGAEREWKEAVSLDANSSQAWEMLGDLYLKQRDFSAARNAFNNVFRLTPNTPDLKARMAIAAYQLKDNNKARELAQSELKVNPDSVAALHVIVELEKNANHDVLLATLKRLAQLQPQNTDVLTQLTDEFHSRDAYDQIIPVASQLIKLAPETADFYLRRGIALYTANPASDSLARAKSDFQKALQLDPKNIEAHRYLGRLYLRENQPRLAIAEFEEVGKGRPYASAHFLELSQAYRRAGNVKHADELQALFSSLRTLNTDWINLNNKIKSDPSNINYYLQIVSLIMKRALSGDESAYHLYSFQAARGELQSVQGYLDGAKQLNPKNLGLAAANQQATNIYNGYVRIADQQLKAGRFAEANETTTHAILLRPNDERTLRLIRQVQGAGFDPLPRYSPEAIPREHHR